MTLYKFKSLQGDGLLHALDIIVNKRIYLSTCNHMNDVEEGIWEYENLNEVFEDGYSGVAKRLREKIDSIRFTSFTDNCTDVLFWAHYAGGFSGIAFEFNIKEGDHDIREMKYSGTPRLSLKQMQRINDGEITAMDAGILTSKSQNWIHENDFPLFHDCNDNYTYVDFEPDKVIFGLRGGLHYDVLRKVIRQNDIRVSYLNKSSENEYEIINT